MSYAGMTIEQISKRLCKSVESVKKYRQSIFLSHFPKIRLPEQDFFTKNGDCAGNGKSVTLRAKTQKTQI